MQAADGLVGEAQEREGGMFFICRTINWMRWHCKMRDRQTTDDTMFIQQATVTDSYQCRCTVYSKPDVDACVQLRPRAPIRVRVHVASDRAWGANLGAAGVLCWDVWPTREIGIGTRLCVGRKSNSGVGLCARQLDGVDLRIENGRWCAPRF